MKNIPKSDGRYLNDGRVTEKFCFVFEDVLTQYKDISLFLADKFNRDSKDYTLRDSYIVGSVLEGVDNSDLDLLLIASKINPSDYKAIKIIMSEIFYNNIPKSQAIDVFVRPFDEFPERNSFEITKQVKDLVSKCNKSILKKK